MSISERIAAATYRIYPRVTVQCGEALAAEAPRGSLEDLVGEGHCTIVSFRRSGDPVATPVWFGLAGDRLVFRSLASGAKLKRIRRNDRVLVAPCTRRGSPTGPPFIGRARILGREEALEAERIIQGNFGLGRRLYKQAIRDAPAEYVEVREERSTCT